MATLGQILKEAREKRSMTASEVAAATHIKVQHVEDLERDDFSRIAAPAYAKGFIRLYADFLDLDPAPLVQEYVEKHAPAKTPAGVAVAGSAVRPAPGSGAQDAPPAWAELIGNLPWQRAAIVLVGLVVVLFVLSAISRLVRWPGAEDTVAVTERAPVTSLSLIKEPPEPYVEGLVQP